MQLVHHTSPTVSLSTMIRRCFHFFLSIGRVPIHVQGIIQIVVACLTIHFTKRIWEQKYALQHSGVVKRWRLAKMWFQHVRFQKSLWQAIFIHIWFWFLFWFWSHQTQLGQTQSVTFFIYKNSWRFRWMPTIFGFLMSLKKTACFVVNVNLPLRKPDFPQRPETEPPPFNGGKLAGKNLAHPLPATGSPHPQRSEMCIIRWGIWELWRNSQWIPIAWVMKNDFDMIWGKQFQYLTWPHGKGQIYLAWWIVVYLEI